MHTSTYGSVFWMRMSSIVNVSVGNGLRTSTVRCDLKSLCSVLPAKNMAVFDMASGTFLFMS